MLPGGEVIRINDIDKAVDLVRFTPQHVYEEGRERSHDTALVVALATCIERPWV